MFPIFSVYFFYCLFYLSFFSLRKHFTAHHTVHGCVHETAGIYLYLKTYILNVQKYLQQKQGKVLFTVLPLWGISVSVSPAGHKQCDHNRLRQYWNITR